MISPQAELIVRRVLSDRFGGDLRAFSCEEALDRDALLATWERHLAAFDAALAAEPERREFYIEGRRHAERVIEALKETPPGELVHGYVRKEKGWSFWIDLARREIVAISDKAASYFDELIEYERQLVLEEDSESGSRRRATGG